MLSIPTLLIGLAMLPLGTAATAAGPQASASTPENGRIVFTRYRGGQMSLYTIEPSGADERAVSAASGNQEFPAWSPDGTRLAFWRTSLQCLFQCGGPGEIVVVDPDGSRVDPARRIGPDRPSRPRPATRKRREHGASPDRLGGP